MIADYPTEFILFHSIPSCQHAAKSKPAFVALLCVVTSLFVASSASAQQEATSKKASVEKTLATQANQPCGQAPEGMACIPGGLFARQKDAAQPTAITTFYMDKTEVTYADYMACVKAKKCPANGAGPRYRGYNDAKQPISGVSWFDAVSYCKAQGKQLPTEAQWEYAARGPKGELNPWGNAKATCKLAIIKDSKGRSCGVNKPGTKPEAGRLFKVASRPAGRYGLFDMVGNVQEWVWDWHSVSLKKCGAACSGLDPKGPCQGAKQCKGHRKRVLKGGSWYWPASHATGVHRRANVPSNRPFHHFGFRCAATLKQGGMLVGAKATEKK